MKKREEWGSRFGFIMAAVGSAIGLGNIWRFPYKAYDNGGGAFLLPYFFALLTAGIPVLILEFGLGHKIRRATPTLFARLSSKTGLKFKLEWLGWWQILVCMVISIYYVIIVGWTLSYVYFAITSSWGTKTKDFFFNNFLKISKGPLDISGFNTGVLIAVFFVWLVNWGVLFSGVKKGIEFINKIFMPVLILLVLTIMFKTITLEGAKEGLNYLFTPKFSEILNVKCWSAAYGQIFFSLSIGFAIMLTYSSYLPKKSDLVNNAFITGFLNCGFSILSGIMIFAILGHMAHAEKVPVNEVVGSGIGLAFITIPRAINYLPAPALFGTLFFLALTIAGFSSFISINEPVVAAFMDKYNVKRKPAVTIITIIGLILSLLLCTNAGLYLIDIIDHFIENFGILLTGLIEILILAYLIKLSFIKDHINPISDFKVKYWWNICLKFITPLVLLYIAYSKIAERISEPYGKYDQSALILFGWLIVFAILIIAIAISMHKGSEIHNQETTT